METRAGIADCFNGQDGLYLPTFGIFFAVQNKYLSIELSDTCQPWGLSGLRGTAVQKQVFSATIKARRLQGPKFCILDKSATVDQLFSTMVDLPFSAMVDLFCAMVDVIIYESIQVL